MLHVPPTSFYVTLSASSFCSRTTIMKPRTMQTLPSPYFFHPVKSQYPPRNIPSRTLSLYFPCNVSKRHSRHKIRREILFYNVLQSNFFHITKEKTKYWKECQQTFCPQFINARFLRLLNFDQLMSLPSFWNQPRFWRNYKVSLYIDCILHSVYQTSACIKLWKRINSLLFDVIEKITFDFRFLWQDKTVL